MSYFRILINVNGQKLFRTSRLYSAKNAQEVFTRMASAFTSENLYTVQILAVGQDAMGPGQGLIIDDVTLEDYVVAEMEDQGVIGPLSPPPEVGQGFLSEGLAATPNSAPGDDAGDFDPAQSPIKGE